MSVIKIKTISAIVFNFPCLEEKFTVKENIELTLRPQKEETYFFWKTKNNRGVMRVVPLSINKINTYIQEKKSVL